MKQLLLISMLIMIMGCNDADMAENLKRPVILVGKRKDDRGWAIVVRGKDGETVTVGSGFYYSNAIGESYNTGDTLK